MVNENEGEKMKEDDKVDEAAQENNKAHVDESSDDIDPNDLGGNDEEEMK